MDTKRLSYTEVESLESSDGEMIELEEMGDGNEIENEESGEINVLNDKNESKMGLLSSCSMIIGIMIGSVSKPD